jgi:hypothetical protein
VHVSGWWCKRRQLYKMKLTAMAIVATVAEAVVGDGCGGGDGQWIS